MSTVESIARPRRNGERRRAPTASISKESPYKLITNVRSSLMAVNIHITIIELNALHTKRQNLFQELDAVIHLLMEAKHWGLRKSRNATSLNSRFRSEERFSRNAETDLVCRLLLEKKKTCRSPPMLKSTPSAPAALSCSATRSAASPLPMPPESKET